RRHQRRECGTQREDEQSPPTISSQSVSTLPERLVAPRNRASTRRAGGSPGTLASRFPPPVDHGSRRSVQPFARRFGAPPSLSSSCLRLGDTLREAPALSARAARHE